MDGKYDDVIRLTKEFIDNGGIYVRSPYPTHEELAKARLENPNCSVFGGYGKIILIPIPGHDS